MQLGALLGTPLGANATETVTGFAIDHRKVAPGTIFGAFRGSRFNGEDFIPAAIAAGAIVVVACPGNVIEGAVPIFADEPRRKFALLAGKFFAPFPATTVAVTGTNGKTSTVELTRQLWRMAGHHAASIGTLGVTTSDETVTTGLTTPDVVTFLSNMAGLAREGVTHAAFEASSHGLDQYRTEGLPVRAAAFTNLSRDHLDYHGDMAAYLTAKLPAVQRGRRRRRDGSRVAGRRSVGPGHRPGASARPEADRRRLARRNAAPDRPHTEPGSGRR